MRGGGGQLSGIAFPAQCLGVLGAVSALKITFVLDAAGAIMRPTRLCYSQIAITVCPAFIALPPSCPHCFIPPQ